MAKVKAGVTSSTADGKCRDNVDYVAGCVSGDTAVDFELKDGSTVKLNLPTADPEVAGQLWSNSGVVTVSAGS